jgi:hypothetical protein
MIFYHIYTWCHNKEDHDMTLHRRESVNTSLRVIKNKVTRIFEPIKLDVTEDRERYITRSFIMYTGTLQKTLLGEDRGDM